MALIDVLKKKKLIITLAAISVAHRILLIKLHNAGISDEVVSPTATYLKNTIDGYTGGVLKPVTAAEYYTEIVVETIGFFLGLLLIVLIFQKITSKILKYYKKNKNASEPKK